MQGNGLEKRGDHGREFGGEFVPTPHGPLFARHVGEGEPAFFVHGLGGESLEFADVCTALAERLESFAIDLPGFGESPPPRDGDLSIDGHARAVIESIEALGCAPAHLVGNSLGGAVATRVASERLDLVRSLTLISPALPDLRPRLWSSQLLVALVPVLGPWLVRRTLLGDPERLARRVVWFCYGNPRALTSERLAEELDAVRRRAALPHTVRVYRASLRALVSAYFQLGRRKLWRQAEQVVVPTLLLYGGRDKLVDPRMARRAGATFPNARVVLLREAGHVSHLEFPERVAALMGEFLDQDVAGASVGPGVGNGQASWDR